MTVPDKNGNPLLVGLVSYGSTDGCELGYVS